MSTVIDPNKDADSTGGVNVLGGGGGQAAPVADTGAAAPSAEGGSSMIQSQGGSVNNATSQGSTANKGASKASSGMFTNIQNYVKKNQPQAQKMAGAATQDFSKQAGEIRQAAESKQAQQKQALQANQQAMTEAQGFAQQQVGQIMGTAEPIQYGGAAPTEAPTEPVAPVAPAQYTASEDDAKRFRDLMGGTIAGVNQVGGLDLSQQQSKASALQSLAQGTSTEQGRRNLLKETFQDRGGYSRGQSGLDQLIVSGDQGARESMIQGTQGLSQQLGQDIGTMRTLGGEAVAGQKIAQQESKDFVNKLIRGETGALTGLETEQEGLTERLSNLSLGGTISDEDLASFGVTREQVSNLYGVDPASISRNRGVTADQRNKMNALYDIIGDDSMQYEESDVYNPQGFLDKIASNKAAYEEMFGATDVNNYVDSFLNSDKEKWRRSNSPGFYMDGPTNYTKEWQEAYDTNTDWTGPRESGTYFDQYRVARKAQEDAARAKYKYGQGLTAPVPEEIV